MNALPRFREASCHAAIFVATARKVSASDDDDGWAGATEHVRAIGGGVLLRGDSDRTASWEITLTVRADARDLCATERQDENRRSFDRSAFAGGRISRGEGPSPADAFPRDRYDTKSLYGSVVFLSVYARIATWVVSTPRIEAAVRAKLRS